MSYIRISTGALNTVLRTGVDGWGQAQEVGPGVYSRSAELGVRGEPLPESPRRDRRCPRGHAAPQRCSDAGGERSYIMQCPPHVCSSCVGHLNNKTSLEKHVGNVARL